MGCCGLFSRKKKPGEPEGSTPGASPSAAASPNTAATHRGATLNTIQSTNSVYFDASEELEQRQQSITSTESGSPHKGAEESKGPLSAIVDAFTRRTSLKARTSLEQRASENGGADGTPPKAGLSSLGSGTGGATVPQSAFSRPFAGASFKRGEQVGSTDGVECWQVADATTFKVRGHDYMSTKRKVPSRGAIYRLIGVDAYSFEQKIYHVAQHIQLPEAPQVGPDMRALPQDQQLPPLLVMNIQLPLHKPGLLARNMDGKGVSLVYYFALPEGFELEHAENKAAISLLQRFVHNGKEQNGEKTRDRLKLIARVVNVEEWAKAGPLSGYEHGLLTKYNDKPILTRPQQAFYTGQNYLEIDLDIHSYAWVARQAFERFIPRLGPVVFENAFVVQGNRAEELPEVIMACARVSRIDLYKVQPFPASLRKTKSHRTTVEMHPDAPPLVCTTFPDDTFSTRTESGEPDRISEAGEEEALTPKTGR